MSWATTMITRHSHFGRPPTRALRASAPLMLFTANQPTPAMTAFNPAGRTLPRKPKPVRLSTIWHSPFTGPQLESTPWVAEPSAVPTTMARKECQKLSPKNSGPMIPTPMVANSRLGELHVHSSCSGVPCRSLSGIRSTPPGSTATVLEPYLSAAIGFGSSMVVTRWILHPIPGRGALVGRDLTRGKRVSVNWSSPGDGPAPHFS